MQALRPWSGMAGLKHEMDRLFDRFFEPGWTEMAPMSEWEPKIDLAESKDTITVKAEVHGVEQKDISVSLENGVLTIKGEKQQQKEEKDKRYHRVERSYGAFYRAMRLPSPIDTGKTTATFNDGVVTIIMPKAPGAAGTMIPVKAA